MLYQPFKKQIEFASVEVPMIPRDSQQVNLISAVEGHHVIYVAPRESYFTLYLEVNGCVFFRVSHRFITKQYALIYAWSYFNAWDVKRALGNHL